MQKRTKHKHIHHESSSRATDNGCSDWSEIDDQFDHFVDQMEAEEREEMLPCSRSSRPENEEYFLGFADQKHSEQKLKIRELNDQLRYNGKGGIVTFTQGVLNMSADFIAGCIETMRNQKTFNLGNDPWAEHDFGQFCHQGHELFWKIDYYDLDLMFHSPDPTDENVTKRVLTLMLAEEY